MANIDLDAVDPTFVEDLIASQPAAKKVAEWLSGEGFPVIFRPTRVRPNAEQRLHYADKGDLEIFRTVEVLQVVEAKQRPGIDFTSKETFPYPSVIVDVKATYDAKPQKPMMYVIVNSKLTHAIIIKNSTNQHWFEKDHFARGRTRRYYECPLEFVRFLELEPGK